MDMCLDMCLDMRMDPCVNISFFFQFITSVVFVVTGMRCGCIANEPLVLHKLKQAITI